MWAALPTSRGWRGASPWPAPAWEVCSRPPCLLGAEFQALPSPACLSVCLLFCLLERHLPLHLGSTHMIQGDVRASSLIINPSQIRLRSQFPGVKRWPCLPWSPGQPLPQAWGAPPLSAPGEGRSMVGDQPGERGLRTTCPDAPFLRMLPVPTVLPAPTPPTPPQPPLPASQPSALDPLLHSGPSGFPFRFPSVDGCWPARDRLILAQVLFLGLVTWGPVGRGW